MELKKTLILIGVILLIVISPLILAATGLSVFIEDYALARPDSGFAEWLARKFVGIYLLVFREDKRMSLAENYLETFNEDSAVYDEGHYKSVFWAYADACLEELRPGKAGIGYYKFAESFPDDERADQAMDLARKFGYRDALQPAPQ